MIWHVLGWLTVAADVGGAAWLVRYLASAGRPARLRPPEIVSAELHLSSGSDYVGWV